MGMHESGVGSPRTSAGWPASALHALARALSLRPSRHKVMQPIAPDWLRLLPGGA